MLEKTYWTKTVDGTEYWCELREAEPGVYHVSAELMHQMLRELGLTPTDDASSNA